MGAVEDKILKAWEKAGETVLKHSERWTVGQKIVAFLVCLLAGAALVSGRDSVKVAGGLSIALFGIAFLTFRRRTVESEMLVLKDSGGKPRIAMSAEGGLVFFDENMRPRMLANLFNGRPVIHMEGDKERLVVVLTENGAVVTLGKSDGTGSSARMTRKGLNIGSSRGGLWLAADDKSANVILTLPDEKPGLCLSLTDSGAVARVGRDDRANVCLMALPDGNLGISLTNESGEMPALLGSSGALAHLSFFGEKGHRVARYPDDESVKNYARVAAE